MKICFKHVNHFFTSLHVYKIKYTPLMQKQLITHMYTLAKSVHIILTFSALDNQLRQRVHTFQ